MNLRALVRERPVCGTIIRSPAPALVETVAAGGLDFVLIDHMSSPIDWETSAAMAMAAKAAGIAALYRPSSSPHSGDLAAYQAAQASRALSVGFDGLFVSIRGLADVEAVTAVADRTWQRRMHVVENVPGDVSSRQRSNREEILVIAQFETLESLESLDAVAKSPGLDGLAVANTDITAEATDSLNAEDDRVVSIIDRVAQACEQNDLALWCNTGYGFPRLDEMAERAAKLRSRGARLILFQSAEFILLNALKQISASTR